MLILATMLNKPISENIQAAVKALRAGEVIAYPTEAVFGLGCDPFSRDAVTRLLEIKGRSPDKGLILIADSWERVMELTEPVSPLQLAAAQATWPGPFTWVFPASAGVPMRIRGTFNSVALRVTDHPVARTLCELFGGPIVSTSANVSGGMPARDYKTAKLLFGDVVQHIVDEKVGGLTQPTEIRDVLTRELIRG